jgi:hypothetical protein
MRGVLSVWAAIAALAFAGGAQAALFNLGSTSGATAVPGGYQKTVDGITLTVTAGTFTGSGVTPGGNGADPQIYSFGTGVWTDNDGQHTIDGYGPNELVILTFSDEVSLDALLFGYFDFLDDFDFFVDTDGDGLLEHIATDIDIPGSGLYTFTSAFVSSVFGVGADHWDDSFKLRKVYVSAPPEIPAPAALPLFLAGAAGLGLAGFRRKKLVRG